MCDQRQVNLSAESWYVGLACDESACWSSAVERVCESETPDLAVDKIDSCDCLTKY